jgi:hypothetical protein
MREISSELTEAEEAQYLARRKHLWAQRGSNERTSPETQKISARGRKNEGRPESFAAETAKVAGQSKRTINQKIARAEKIEPEVTFLPQRL